MLSKFEEGGEAFRQGIPFKECPYKGAWPLDVDATSWRAGWIDASLYPDRGLRALAS